MARSTCRRYHSCVHYRVARQDRDSSQPRFLHLILRGRPVETAPQRGQWAILFRRPSFGLGKIPVGSIYFCSCGRRRFSLNSTVSHSAKKWTFFADAAPFIPSLLQIRQKSFQYTKAVVRELPFMTSAKFLDFLIRSPLSVFGSDLHYKIHATFLTTSASPLPPPPLMRTSYMEAPSKRREFSHIMMAAAAATGAIFLCDGRTMECTKRKTFRCRFAAGRALRWSLFSLFRPNLSEERCSDRNHAP